MRPTPMLVLVSASWLLGLFGGAVLPEGPWRAALALVALGGAVSVAALGGDRRAAGSALGALALFAGIGASAPPPEPPVPPGGLARLDGTVLESGADHATVAIRSGRLLEGDHPLPAPFRLWVRGHPLPSFAEVRLLATLTPRPRFRNPSPRPDWPEAHPVTATAHLAPGSHARVIRPSALGALLDRVRRGLRRGFARTLDARPAGLARALVLGERDAVHPADQEAVRSAGLAHVLAVSGLHVAIVSGVFVALLGALLRRSPLGARMDTRQLSSALGIPAALGYAAVAGSAPSAVRAAVTASLLFLLLALGRRPTLGRVVAGAVMLITLVAPAQILRPGFLLSVLAVAAILTTPARKGFFRMAFAVSARTTLATAPLIVWLFGSVPLAGLVLNVVLVPVASLALVPLACVHGVLAAWVPASTRMTAALFDTLALAFLEACDVAARLPLSVHFAPLTPVEGIAMAGAIAALLLPIRPRARALLLLSMLLVALGTELHLRHREAPRDVLRVTQLDVGQGDAALLDLPDGRLMLLDAGGAPFGGPDPGRHVLGPLLEARRRKRVDVAVITHPHPDHYGGLGWLAHHIPVGEVWTSGQALAEEPDGRAARLLRTLVDRGTRVRTAEDLCGPPRAFGAARVEVLWPCPGFDAGYDPNDNSLVLSVRLGDKHFLFAGDLEADGERALLAHRLELRADVLKVPHHGSRTSSTEPFLDAVAPSVALVSAGRANRFGHPHREVLHRLRARGTRVLRTDRRGGVVITTDGHALEVQTAVR